MQDRHIAFLRAINVGKRRVKMDHLRTLFEALGFANVATFIASGNVIFEAAVEDTRALEQQIERHLRQELGYEVTTFVRSAAELSAIAQHQPFPASEVEGHALSIAFLSSPPPDEAAQKLLSLRTEIDDFVVHEREVYWLCRTRLSESAFSGGLLEKTLGMAATVRNVTTVQKLAAKVT
ncbi:MAG: DUF1697 domain-containing protein [Ardenticatenales bacterium]|nr:DUF1697 domain-containing protein [Ardenticatenales bacterium]